MKKYLVYVLIVILFGGGIFAYYKMIPKKSETQVFQEIPITDEVVTSLYQNVNPSTDYVSLKDLYVTGNFSNEYILGISIANVIKMHPGITSVSTSDLDTSLKKIFGNISYQNETGYLVSPYVCKFDYHADTKFYDIITGCDGSNEKFLERKLIKARKSMNEYILVEKSVLAVVPLESTEASIYKDINETTLIKTMSPLEYDTFKIDDVLDEAETYEYHFKFDGENFVFTQLNRMD